MRHTLSRRDLAALALLAPLPAQDRPPETDDLGAQREQLKKNSEALKKFAVPMATEPAFVFKP